MVILVDRKHLSELLRRVGIRAFLVELTEYIREDFARWPQFERIPRLASHSAQGVIELMPTADGRLYSFKFVNGHPGNPREGKLTVGAFGALADVATGYPLLVSEMTILTALRTAATSALAASLLARSDSRTHALIGTGAQAEFQALAFQAVLGVGRLRYFDIDGAAMSKLATNLAGSDLVLEPCESVEEALRGADIVTTATASKSRQRVITPDLVRPGMHINGIGGDCPGKTEIDPEVLKSARVFVEFEPQTRIEGDIQVLDPQFSVTELWQVVAGHVPGRRSSEEITVFDSVGFAVEDFSTLRYVYDKVRETGIGGRFEAIPDLADPKNLYGCLTT